MKKLAFVFPGYGCAHAGMGKDVCNYSEECAEIYKKGSEALGIDAAELSIKGKAAEVNQHFSIYFLDLLNLMKVKS